MRPPVFLLGAPRSGTTLLYKCLCLHGEASWFSNYGRRLPGIPQVAVLGRAARHFPNARRRAWFGADASNAYVYSQRRQLHERAFPMPVEGEPIFGACGIPELPSGIAAEDAPQRLSAFVRSACQASGAPVFVNKRIANNQRVPLLETAFPDARFIVITRDGRSVAASLAKVDWWPRQIVFWYGGTPASWAAEGRDPWELCGREWVEQLRTMEEGLASVDPARVHRVRFEQLLEDPSGVVGAARDFAGLSQDRRFDQAVSQIRFPPDGSWRDKLDPAALITIEAVQAPLLASHGYRA